MYEQSEHGSEQREKMLASPPKIIVHTNAKMTATILVLCLVMPAFCDNVKPCGGRIAMGSKESVLDYSNLTFMIFQEILDCDPRNPLGLPNGPEGDQRNLLDVAMDQCFSPEISLHASPVNNTSMLDRPESAAEAELRKQNTELRDEVRQLRKRSAKEAEERRQEEPESDSEDRRHVHKGFLDGVGSELPPIPENTDWYNISHPAEDLRDGINPQTEDLRVKLSREGEPVSSTNNDHSELSILLNDTIVINNDDERLLDYELPIPIETIHGILPDKRNFTGYDRVSRELAQKSRDIKNKHSVERPMVDASMIFIRKWGTTVTRTTPQSTGNLSQTTEAPGEWMQVDVSNDNLRIRWKLVGSTNYDFHTLARVKSGSYMARKSPDVEVMGSAGSRDVARSTGARKRRGPFRKKFEKAPETSQAMTEDRTKGESGSTPAISPIEAGTQATTFIVDSLIEGSTDFPPIEQFDDSPESFPVFHEIYIKGLFKNVKRAQETREHLNAIEWMGEAELRNHLGRTRNTRERGLRIYQIYDMLSVDPTFRASTAKKLLENSVAFAARRIRHVEKRLEELERQRCKNEGARPRLECRPLQEQPWDKRRRGGGGSGTFLSFRRGGRGRGQRTLGW